MNANRNGLLNPRGLFNKVNVTGRRLLRSQQKLSDLLQNGRILLHLVRIAKCREQEVWGR